MIGICRKAVLIGLPSVLLFFFVLRGHPFVAWQIPSGSAAKANQDSSLLADAQAGGVKMPYSWDVRGYTSDSEADSFVREYFVESVSSPVVEGLTAMPPSDARYVAAVDRLSDKFPRLDVVKLYQREWFAQGSEYRLYVAATETENFWILEVHSIPKG